MKSFNLSRLWSRSPNFFLNLILNQFLNFWLILPVIVALPTSESCTIRYFLYRKMTTPCKCVINRDRSREALVQAQCWRFGMKNPHFSADPELKVLPRRQRCLASAFKITFYCGCGCTSRADSAPGEHESGVLLTALTLSYWRPIN